MRTVVLSAIATFWLAGGSTAGPFDKSNELCLTSNPGDCTMVAEYVDGNPRTLREVYSVFEEKTTYEGFRVYFQTATIEHVRCVNHWAYGEVDWDTLVLAGKYWRDGTLPCS